MKLSFILTLLFSFAISGCGKCFEIKTPEGFVELEDARGSYSYRATSADGLVLAVRELEHKPRGTLEFWSKAIENQLRDRHGYALLSSKEVATKGGLKGKALRFGHDEGTAPHLYAVNVYVTESRIYVVEYGGKKELFTARESDFEKSLSEFVGR